MAQHKVLITDFAWPDVEIERAELARYDCDLVVADEHDVASLIPLAREADAIMTCWAEVPGEVIAAGPCRIVSRLGIGLDNIDVAYCTEHGIPVTNVPDYCVIEVAEHTMALLLALARNVAAHHRLTKSGVYDIGAVPTPTRVSGQTLGIVGLGHIGRQVAQRAKPFGLRILSHTLETDCDDPEIELVSLDTLLSESDYVTLHLPLTGSTQHLIGADELARMKPTACLINTARGGIVNHHALAEALIEDRLGGAALDVQDPEPPDLTLPPYDDPRVIVTPHTAFASAESLDDLRRRASRQVGTRLTGGTPEHVVNPEVLTDA